jgi:hypothetical protein
MMFPLDDLEIFSFRNELIKWSKHYPDPGDHLAVLATCRAIYDEARPVLYTNKCFFVHCSWSKNWSAGCVTGVMREAHMAWSISTFQIAPRFVHLQKARSIALNITIDGFAKFHSIDRQRSRLPTDISAASDLSKLRIKLFTASKARDNKIQKDFNLLLVLLGKFLYKGHVTVAIDLSIKKAGIDLQSYYNMLDKMGC